MTCVKPFGDHADDGIVQVSFSLPIARSPMARLAAQSIAQQMGLADAEIVHEIDLTADTTYFIVYGRVEHVTDVRLLARKEENYPILAKEEVEQLVSSKLGGAIRVVGASTGTDTHTLGLDAILNHKGYNGHCGLEAYDGFAVRNLGSQVPNERLIAEAVAMDAHAIMVSQTVTQQNLHIANLTELIDMLEAEGVRDRFIMICGGARISPGLAKELGFDAGFSKRTYAEHVASYLVSTLTEKGERLGVCMSATPQLEAVGS